MASSRPRITIRGRSALRTSGQAQLRMRPAGAEPAVVRRQNRSAKSGSECLFQFIGQERGQVVRRLVEEEKLRRVGDQQSQRQAAALAHGEATHGRVQVSCSDETQLGQRNQLGPLRPEGEV